MACFWTPMSVEVTALPVYPAASLSRPYHSHHSPFCGGNRSLCELGKNREAVGSEGPGALERDLKGAVRALAGRLGLGRASCLHPPPPGTLACPRELATGLLPAGRRLSHRTPAESLL